MAITPVRVRQQKHKKQMQVARKITSLPTKDKFHIWTRETGGKSIRTMYRRLAEIYLSGESSADPTTGKTDKRRRALQLKKLNLIRTYGKLQRWAAAIKLYADGSSRVDEYPLYAIVDEIEDEAEEFVKTHLTED